MGITVDLIKEYYSPIYIETGCSHGDGIVCALEAGVERCFGIECDAVRCGVAIKRFEKNKNVYIIGGKSEYHLRSIICNTNNGVLIFLDAHKMGGIGGPNESYALLGELEEIRRSNKINITIMIDDIRLLGGELKSTISDVAAAIYRINNHYKIKIENSNTNAMDILVAYL